MFDGHLRRSTYVLAQVQKQKCRPGRIRQRPEAWGVERKLNQVSFLVQQASSQGFHTGNWLRDLRTENDLWRKNVWRRRFGTVNGPRNGGIRVSKVEIEDILNASSFKDGMKAFNELVKLGHKFDHEGFVFTKLVSLCRKEKGQSSWKKALLVLDKMQSIGVKPNVITYNAVLSALAAGGR